MGKKGSVMQRSISGWGEEIHSLENTTVKKRGRLMPIIFVRGLKGGGLRESAKRRSLGIEISGGGVSNDMFN